MEFSVKVEGLDKIQNASRQMQESVNKEIIIALDAVGQKVRNEAITSINSGKKSGRIYKRGKTVTHQASSAGEAPASDTGTLAGSIASYVFKEKLEAVVLSRLKYSSLLEFGTAKIAPRPFMFPAYEKTKNWIKDRLNDAVVRAAKKSVTK